MILGYEVRGIDALRRALEPARLIGKPVRDLFSKAAIFAQRDAREGAAGLEAIANSIAAEASPMSARVVVHHPAAFVAEFGRRPGSKQPPLEVIRAAASRWGLDAQDAFPIARAIAERGVKGRFFIARTRDRLLHLELPQLVAAAARDIESIWSGRLR